MVLRSDFPAGWLPPFDCGCGDMESSGLYKPGVLTLYQTSAQPIFTRLGVK